MMVFTIKHCYYKRHLMISESWNLEKALFI